MQTESSVESTDAPRRASQRGSAQPTDAMRGLAAALDAQDWAVATRLVERDWGSLMLRNRELLDQALRSIPAQELLSHPIILAVREIRLRVGGDLGDPDLTAFDAFLPEDPADLERLVSNRSARFVLSAAAAFMIAFRLHGRWDDALRCADRCEAVARIALRHDSIDTAARVPTAYAQIGLTRFQGDDSAGAYLALHEAYDTREQSDDPIVGNDASANIALLLAAEGEIQRASEWLSRYRETPLAADPLDGIEVTAELAETLIRLEDEPGVSSAEREQILDGARVNALGWADALTYVRARSALHRGDPHHALRMLDLDARRTRHHLSSPFFQSWIDAVRCDALMVLGHGTLAEQALIVAQRSAPTVASRARLQLLAGEDHKALATAKTVINHIPAVTRPHLDAMISAAIAHQRLGEGAQAAKLMENVLSMLDRCGVFSVADLHPRDELRSLVASSARGMTRERLERRLSASAAFAPSIELIHLTEAELRALRLLADDRTRGQIASALFLSPNTVKTQLRSLFTKLGADSAAAAVRRGRSLGFLPKDQNEPSAEH